MAIFPTTDIRYVDREEALVHASVYVERLTEIVLDWDWEPFTENLQFTWRFRQHRSTSGLTYDPDLSGVIRITCTLCPDTDLNESIIEHELAHAITMRMFGDVPGHGHEWRSVLKRLAGLNHYPQAKGCHRGIEETL